MNQLWEEKERDREGVREKTIDLGKRVRMARYGKITSWKPSQ